jgi:RimJ/RimL family protein N-acetyltransferase
MESVVLRLHKLGNSIKKISEITQHPEEFVINAIGNKIIIETERLIIREPIIEDFDYIWSMRNDEEVTLFTGGVTKLSKEEIYERHLERCKNFEDKPKEYSVVLKETNEYIGYCGFQYCDILEGIEILYGYSKKHWGKGYASEAAAAVLKFGIESLNLSEIVAAVNSKNVASEKVLLHIGMKYVGEIQWPNQGFIKKYIIKNDEY